LKSNRGKALLMLMVTFAITFWTLIIFFSFTYIIKQPSLFDAPSIIETAEYEKVDVTYYEEPYKVTVYTSHSDDSRWGYKTATGVRSTHLATCAVDPGVIPLGSTINLNGLTLKAVDTGSAVKGRVIDIFYDGTDEQARQWLSGFGTKHNMEVDDK